MIIGVPKEIKNHEYRVGMVPSSVQELIRHGHQVLFQKNAGLGIGEHDKHYREVGAKIVDSPEEIFNQANLIVKVKEPQPEECKMLREGQTLFTYLHLAPDPEQTKALLASGCTAIAYETVTDSRGGLPLLAPMSEVAGRMSIQAGTRCLEKAQGGKGLLLAGVPGVSSGHVVILGAGVVGSNAIRIAVGLGARVTVIDKSITRLRELDLIYNSKIHTLYATSDAIEKSVLDADLVIGAVLVPGGAAPKLITEEMVRNMHQASAIVDVSIDQGGCCETSYPTTHQDPIYIVDGIVHYCVANMPGAVPCTSAYALNNATLPFIIELANHGTEKACLKDPHLLNGLNIHRGMVTYEAVATDLGLKYTKPSEALLQ